MAGKINRKAQITVFIIIAIIIVAGVFMIFIFRGKILNVISKEKLPDPQPYVEKCVKDAGIEAIDKLKIHGGEFEPKNYKLYNDTKIEYLCYTNEYFKPCVNQRPLLKEYIERQLAEYTKKKLENCTSLLKSEWERTGFTADIKDVSVQVEITPKEILFNINAPIKVSKGDSSKEQSDYRVSIGSQVYDLLAMASRILDEEAKNGDVDQLLVMLANPSIKVDKKKFDAGEKIYILSWRNSEDFFEFATKTYPKPVGQ